MSSVSSTVSTRRRMAVRSALVLSGAAVVIASLGAVSYTPGQQASGYQYRIRFTTVNAPNPNAAAGGGGGPGGGGGQNVTVQATNVVSGNKLRLWVTVNTEGGGGGGGRGGGGAGGGQVRLEDQIFLKPDSVKVITLNPIAKTYTEGTSFPGNINGIGLLQRGFGRGGPGGGAFAFNFDSAGGARGGRGGDAGGGGGRGGGGAGGGGNQANLLPVTDPVVRLDSLPGVDTIAGYPTKHYRIITEFTITPITEPVRMRTVADIWTANLPFRLVNPWDATLGTGAPSENLRGVQVLQAAQRRKIPGTPLRIITTIPPMGILGGIFGRGGAGFTPPDTSAEPPQTQKLEITSITPLPVVADTMFAVPPGYSKAPARGGGGGM